MSFLKKKNVDDFSDPTQLPSSEIQAKEWQEKNLTWWESHPMRYDWKEKIDVPEFTKEYYEEIDARFFSLAAEFLPPEAIPFDSLIHYADLHDRDVLEIGVGNGSVAQLLAKHSKSFSGIDITDFAIKSTTERMKCFGLQANVIRMDAEKMEFEDESFDFIWSWGVIHHSSDTRKILKEMNRVLRPGGRAVTMVYHRNWWNYWIVSGLFYGILQGSLLKTKSIHKIMQLRTDGALARFYSTSEWRELVAEFFQVEIIQIYGSKAQIIPLPFGRMKKIIMSILPNSISHLLTNRLRMGTFLVSELNKEEES